jgi:hypothetical protein
MATVSLEDLFSEIDGKEFATRRELERAVVDVFNRHVSELPVGFTYEDALEAALSRGWFDVSGFEDHGVRVNLHANGLLETAGS